MGTVTPRAVTRIRKDCAYSTLYFVTSGYRYSKSQCTVNKDGNRHLHRSTSQTVVRRLVCSFGHVLGEQLYDFLPVCAKGYLGCSLSAQVTDLHICTVVQQESHNV